MFSDAVIRETARRMHTRPIDQTERFGPQPQGLPFNVWHAECLIRDVLEQLAAVASEGG